MAFSPSILLEPWIPPLLLLMPLLAAADSSRAAWRRGLAAVWAALAVALLQIVAAWLTHSAGSAVERLMLLLILVLAVFILRFSRSYLRDQQGQQRYVRLFLTTVACSALVVTLPSLDLLLAAWALGSFGMNGLLQFYPERRAAQLAAHKKFLVSRLAELCIGAACVLLHHTLGTLRIDGLATSQQANQHAPLNLAAALLVTGVILKTAQMPLHGWLMQVMEAPTPVSALLHAGVVNLGGIVLLRVHPLLDASPLAQALLLSAGAATLLLASIVMTTRVSIKVRLAWSTCAQMGFLLAECSLGLYRMAALHLIGHSLYKAHAFLRSGTVVESFRSMQLTGDAALLPQRPTPPPKVLALALSCAGVWACVHAAALLTLHLEPLTILIAGIGLAPLLSTGETFGERLAGLWQWMGMVALLLCWHLPLGALLSNAPERSRALQAAFALALLLLALFQTFTLPTLPLAGAYRLRRWAFHGFYLDEAFTRVVFAVWPARYQAPQPGQALRQPAGEIA